jgi:hypothetical protein
MRLFLELIKEFKLFFPFSVKELFKLKLLLLLEEISFEKL